MTSLNRIEIIGNVGCDAEVKKVGERTLVKFSVAVTKSYKEKSGEMKTDITWFACYYWTNNDKLARYITKGMKLFVGGEMCLNVYTDNEGNKKSLWFISVTNIIFLGSNESTGENVNKSNEAKQPTNEINSPKEIADKVSGGMGGDLPF